MSASIAVIIPYFQRRPGLLRRAVDSVLGQEGAPSVRVIVIDDQSPVPARAELVDRDRYPSDAVTVVTQRNRGAAGARNAGLDHVQPGCRWIAFLDSDDRWRPDHLARAVSALDAGYDFYFADHARDGVGESHFSYSRLDPRDHVPLDPGRSLYAFQGSLFDRVLDHSPVGTSTVVMRAAVLGRLRFDETIGLCDDLFFWLSAARLTSRAVFCADVQASYGRGVNISLHDDWASNRSLQYTLANRLYYRKVERTCGLTSTQRAVVDGKLVMLRRQLAHSLLGMAVKGKLPDPVAIARFLTVDPEAARCVLSELRQATLKRLRTRDGSCA